MTPSIVPGIVAWPLIAFMTLVLAGRYRWFNHNLYEHYFNNTLAFLLAAQILREHLVQDMFVNTAFMTAPGTWQLSTVVMSYSFTEFIGFSLLWSGASEAETRRKHRYYRLGAVFLAAGLLIFGTRARIAGVPLELLGGWDFVTTLTCTTTMLAILATRLIWNSVRELPIASRRRERWIALSTLAMGVVGVGVVLQEAALQIFDQFGWTHTAHYRQHSHAAGLFFGILAPFVIAAVPFGMKLLGAVGLDSTTRSWRRLQPLRYAMRNVVPECACELEDDQPWRRRKSQLQLHHTVVEIRDAILRLRPYTREIPRQEAIRFLDELNAVPPREQHLAVAALRLANAVRTKAAGTTPQSCDLDSTLTVTSRAATLDEEAAELVILANWWPAAYAAAADRKLHPATDTKESPTP